MGISNEARYIIAPSAQTWGLTSCIPSSVTHTFAQVAHSDATMPSPMKMTYFDGRGRGEILRLILAKGGKKYEDVRITFDQWPELKPQTPFGGLPMLEFNGKKFGQGLALALYLARENGLYGANNLENLMIDQILMCREDILVPEAKVKFEKDEKARADLLKGLVGATYPKFLGFSAARPWLMRSARTRPPATPPTPSAPSGPGRCAASSRRTPPSPAVPRSPGSSVPQLAVGSLREMGSVTTRSRLLSRTPPRSSVRWSPRGPASTSPSWSPS